jgi:hypothetical protein
MIADEPGRFCRQGAVVATWRTYRGRKLGPYYRLAFRRDGRQCSVYLGRCRELAERVRAAIDKLRVPLHHVRQIARMRAAVKASLRREKLRLDGQLRKLGLYLKGFETRGWRTVEPAISAAAANFRRLVGITHRPGTVMVSVPLLRRSSACGNLTEKHCFCEAVAHRRLTALRSIDSIHPHVGRKARGERYGGD